MVNLTPTFKKCHFKCLPTLLQFVSTQLCFAAAETDSWRVLVRGALSRPWHASHPLPHHPSTPFSSSSNTTPSRLSFIKAKVAQGSLMLQMVALVLTTRRLRNSLQQAKVIAPPPPSTRPPHPHPLPHFLSSSNPPSSLFPPKMLFSINQSSRLKLVFNFLPNPR